MDKVQALTAFWNSFNIPAYDVNSVPDDAQTPYLTFEVVTDSFDNEVAVTNSLWYKSTSWKDITQKADLIGETIGRGGKLISYDGGAIWIKRANPFSQRLSENDTTKRIILNFSLEYLSEN